MITLKFNVEYVEKILCIIEVQNRCNLWKIHISRKFTNVNSITVRLPYIHQQEKDSWPGYVEKEQHITS